MEKTVCEEMQIKRKLGYHFIVDAYTEDKSLLEDVDLVSKALTDAADAAEATKIGLKMHKFSPHGLTGILLLAESHISIHTWPEHNYIAMDIFTCGKDPTRALEHLKNALKINRIYFRNLDRGMF
jgi:S-adenosylmethionine decarboxylase